MKKEQHRHTKEAFVEHLFEFRSLAKKKLILSLVITLVVMIIELIGGFMTHSIALISDAGHMFTHCFAIGVSLGAIIIAQKPPCHHRTYGLYRAEILASFINGLFLLLVVGVIVYEAIMRLIHPEEILSISMLMIGLIGLLVNIISIMILHGSQKQNINIRGVFYHMIADAAASVGIVIGALVIHITGWLFIDPLISLGISAIIVFWAWGILRESSRILLEMAPRGLTVDTLRDDLIGHFPGIKQLYNVHVWTITENMYVFSAHVLLDDSIKVCEDHNQMIEQINKYLNTKYHIIESTIQIISTEQAAACQFKTTT